MTSSFPAALPAGFLAAWWQALATKNLGNAQLTHPKRNMRHSGRGTMLFFSSFSPRQSSAERPAAGRQRSWAVATSAALQEREGLEYVLVRCFAARSCFRSLSVPTSDGHVGPSGRLRRFSEPYSHDNHFAGGQYRLCWCSGSSNRRVLCVLPVCACKETPLACASSRSTFLPGDFFAIHHAL